MIAVIELKGKQFRVAEDQVIRTRRCAGNAGDKVEADQV
ncbi:MAG TPA: 50S ribosomal protein L21, partial [Firmicutes bacterium]|nr:50S ribosomal protein L21 [Bacillota bacterium]